MNNLYEMIFKRKSFHLFKDLDEKMSEEDIQYINDCFNNLIPLDKDIKVEFKLVKANKTSCYRQEEYCILMYSEKKDGYLQNIGYIGEQLDLMLVKHDIATLWCGLAKPLVVYSKLKFVIMFAISKCTNKEKYRQDMFKAKRKELEEIWKIDEYKEIGNIVRFAPSACNSQPWIIEGSKDKLSIYRYTKEGKSGIMPEAFAHYYNCIDIGIFMYILELVLEHNSIQYQRIDYKEKEPIDRKYLNAEYMIKK